MIPSDKLRETAVAIAPDYPGIEVCDEWECLYAIKCSYEGTNAANADLHILIKILCGRLNMSLEEMIELGQKVADMTGHVGNKNRPSDEEIIRTLA